MQMQVTETKVQGVINNFDLFEITGSDFFSRRLNESLNLRKTLQDAGQRGAAKRWNTVTQTKIKLD